MYELLLVLIFVRDEFNEWLFYRVIIVEFIVMLFFLYVSFIILMGIIRIFGGSVGFIEIVWVFGGMIFILVYCIVGILGEY